MPPTSALPRSELEVARIVWELGQATVREVMDALPKNRGLEFKTVQTYLRRLEAKGYLRTKRKDKRTKIYLARAQPRRVMRDLIEDFMDRVFDGEAMPLLQHVILDRGLSDEELQQLRGLIKKVEEGPDESGDK